MPQTGQRRGVFASQLPKIVEQDVRLKNYHTLAQPSRVEPMLCLGGLFQRFEVEPGRLDRFCTPRLRRPTGVGEGSNQLNPVNV